jgi:hypothetical protein
VIKDEGIPALLRQVRQPTFVTINHTDFWRKALAEKAFCLACLKLTADQTDDIPHWLRRLLRLPEFKTKNVRMGKVTLVSIRGIRYYQIGESVTHLLSWPASTPSGRQLT